MTQNFLISTRVLGILTHQAQHSAFLLDRLDQILEGTHMLLQHKLSPQLLLSNVISHVLRKVTKTLNKHHNGFQVTQLLPSYYYTYSDFFYSRHNSSLYITLKISISSFHSKFSVYKVRSLPVPLNTSTSLATQLMT